MFLIAIILGNIGFAQSQQGGFYSNAISINDSRIVSWAKGVEVQRGYQGNSTTLLATYGKHYMAQDMPDSTTTSAISLGRKGEAIISFDRPIYNGHGYDFAVYENGFDTNFLELAFVEVSSNGVDYFRFPSQSISSSESDVSPSKIHNLAGKYPLGWGTPFDLDDIDDHPSLDKVNIRFVKLIDVDGGNDIDSYGNIIYDATSSGPSTGFDLTGVCVLNGGNPYQIASFEGLLADSETYELISSSNGVLGNDGNYHKDYISNGIVFEALGLYGGSFACGFGPSNLSNHSSSNEYYTSAAYSGLEGPGSTYLHAYYSDYTETEEHNVIRMEDNSSFRPLGVYVSNSVSSYEYNMPDHKYLYILALGYDSEGGLTDSSYLYLKDNRNGEDINLNTWKWLELSSLGECSKIILKLRSNDDSGWGMNIPAYFTIDNFVIDTNTIPIIVETPLSLNLLNAYDIEADKATLEAELDSGDEILISKGFEWKKASETEWNEVIINSLDLVHTLTELEPNTQYKYRAFAQTEDDVFYSEELSFQTLPSSSLDKLSPQDAIITLYPNPATSHTIISIEGLSQNARIIILDFYGRVLSVYEDISMDNNIELCLNHLPRGVYYIRVISQDLTKTEKLILR